ncbi:MAG TPA: translation elongation factor Ts [bacterium]|jgi:elongation factor Ts|nr:elongation factor Ts [bacterium]MDX9804324.1 translation elongation factor Ts [bacterium]HNZ53578.1 translation elongation factor Ts [bacterium]HOG43696.1 translation elongation factor Ts [bacterium]HPG36230.1 translation elongation factor Ts [bacterium]
MEISASLVKDLRERSGAGMMDCKKALQEANGNMEEAMQILKDKGIAKAAKKAGRVASEGTVLSIIENSNGLLFELNCETDFAAKSEGFKNLSREISGYFMKNASEEGVLVSMEDKFYDANVEKLTTDAVATIGENIKPRRFVKYSGSDSSLIHSYIHMGGKIGVMLEVQSSDKDAVKKPEVVEMSDGIAMQIASMRPDCVDESSFPQDKLESEKRAFLAQVMEMGKPQNIAEKIVEGRIKKFIAENTLLEQAFVMNGDIKVKDLVKETGKKVGAELKIVRFHRFELGEGIEKKENNFAEEVAAQIK